MARHGVRVVDLQAMSFRLKAAHLAMYAIAIALLLYGFWMALNVSLIKGLAVLVASGGVAVQGYLAGYKALQIERRTLIPLRDALRDVSTYLVL